LKFLLLNQTFHPDVASTGQHLADLAAGLVERGHAVTVVTCRRGYDEPETLFARHETWRGIKIRRVGSMGLGKQKKWRRIIDCLSFAILSFAEALLCGRRGVVVALTSPPFISLVGLWVARLYRSRFVYWVMDLNPDEAIAAGWLRPDSPGSKVLEWFSRLSLRGADRVIALDRFMFERIIAKGVAPERISIVPPWSHDPLICFDGAGRERFRCEHGLEGKFVVMYSGNHSPCHPLHTVVEAARRLADQPEIVFCFVGGGTEFRRIRALMRSGAPGESKTIRSRSALNIRCIPYQPLSDLSASLSAADLHLVVMGNAFVGLVHPCKIYNILRVGAPLIYVGPRPSPLFDIVLEMDTSGYLSHGDVDGLIRHIQRLRLSPKRPRNDTQSLAVRFSKEQLLPRLITMLESVGTLREASRKSNRARVRPPIEISDIAG
jgi:glycosyltransferase involved in cell wall biosynthesis